MSGVVCAIRGGPHSKPTIDCAIDLALKHHCPLHFLYVVNIEFLARTSLTHASTISKEMHYMGESITLAAQAVAKKRGVKTDVVVKDGDVVDEIIEVCKETGARYVVVGKPHARVEENVFAHDLLQGFVDRIEKEGKVRVIFSDVDVP